MGAKHAPPQSSSALALMHLTCGHYTRSWRYHILAMWRMWKSEQPPDAILSPTWSLTDVCGSFDILPAPHHKRTTTLLSLRWSGDCFQIGSDCQEDPATPGFVQWRQTLANRTLALHLPGGRQLFVTTSNALWTQQRSSGVRCERRRQDDRGGDDNWSYKTCKAAVKLALRTNQHPAFYRPDVLVAQPTVSKHWRENSDDIWLVKMLHPQSLKVFLWEPLADLE